MLEICVCHMLATARPGDCFNIGRGHACDTQDIFWCVYETAVVGEVMLSHPFFCRSRNGGPGSPGPICPGEGWFRPHACLCDLDLKGQPPCSAGASHRNWTWFSGITTSGIWFQPQVPMFWLMVFRWWWSPRSQQPRAPFASPQWNVAAFETWLALISPSLSARTAGREAARGFPRISFLPFLITEGSYPIFPFISYHSVHIPHSIPVISSLNSHQGCNWWGWWLHF